MDSDKTVTGYLDKALRQEMQRVLEILEVEVIPQIVTVEINSKVNNKDAFLRRVKNNETIKKREEKGELYWSQLVNNVLYVKRSEVIWVTTVLTALDRPYTVFDVSFPAQRLKDSIKVRQARDMRWWKCVCAKAEGRTLKSWAQLASGVTEEPKVEKTLIIPPLAGVSKEIAFLENIRIPEEVQREIQKIRYEQQKKTATEVWQNWNNERRARKNNPEQKETVDVTKSNSDNNVPMGKYVRTVTDLYSNLTVYIDVYKVLNAFGPLTPQRDHAIKKLLCAGTRGGKGIEQDLEEAIEAIRNELNERRSK